MMDVQECSAESPPLRCMRSYFPYGRRIGFFVHFAHARSPCQFHAKVTTEQNNKNYRESTLPSMHPHMHSCQQTFNL